MLYLLCAVDHEGEVLEVFGSKRRDRKAALTFLKRYGWPYSIVTDRLQAYRSATDLWDMLAQALDAFTPTECRNYFAAAGYDQE